MKLSTKAMTISGGLVWGLAMLLAGLGHFLDLPRNRLPDRDEFPLSRFSRRPNLGKRLDWRRVGLRRWSHRRIHLRVAL